MARGCTQEFLRDSKWRTAVKSRQAFMQQDSGAQQPLQGDGGSQGHQNCSLSAPGIGAALWDHGQNRVLL